MEINLKGKRALVTGAGRGIGRTLAKRLVECGADVVAVSKTETNLKTLKEECPQIEIMTLDVSNWEDTEKAVNSISRNIGPIDLLVNNAAIAEYCTLDELTESFVDKIINTNLKSVLNISQIVANDMKKRGQGGCIVNISSIAAKFVFSTSYLVYGMLKAALDQMTRVMAVELGPHNIRVNTINPTGVEDTDIYKHIPPVGQEVFTKTIPLKRLCETSDVADSIIYLLSDKAAMINGANLYVDGGQTTCC